VRTVVRLLVLAAIVAVAIGVAAAGASAGKVHKQALYVRTVPTSSFYVDNDPSGNSAGDLFGSTGDLRRSADVQAGAQGRGAPRGKESG